MPSWICFTSPGWVRPELKVGAQALGDVLGRDAERDAEAPTVSELVK